MKASSNRHAAEARFTTQTAERIARISATVRLAKSSGKRLGCGAGGRANPLVSRIGQRERKRLGRSLALTVQLKKWPKRSKRGNQRLLSRDQ